MEKALKSKPTNGATATFGTTDENGHWSPPNPCKDSPLFYWPPQPKKILKYLFGFPGYLWPKLLLYILLAVGTFYLLEADLASPMSLSATWIGLMLLRNLVMIFIVFGGYHLLLYILKVQGTKQKYHPQWQAVGNKKFLFKNQVYDNIFRTCVSGATIWTAYEVLYVWAFSHDYLPYLSWTQNPVYFVVMLLLIPIFRETHFYFVHRLIHWGPLMKHIHSVHHKNNNVGPWSGLAMHPIEHLLYFSAALIHFIIPSHPIHFLLNIQMAGLTPAAGHIGFEGPLYKGLYPSGDYFHYLHHRYVSCNYGTGSVPWDRWFGHFYNGEGKFSARKNKV
ncbi:MAG: sterol desaturase family protein [Vallitaleaceae bacterium]|nr:sterol desaturase family protein [Vallitaleaceae bacterium]